MARKNLEPATIAIFLPMCKVQFVHMDTLAGIKALVAKLAIFCSIPVG
jgi:hypothetical protein